MISVMVMVKDGIRSETFGLEFNDLGPEELSQVEDIAQELVSRVNRIATIRAAKARRAEEGPKRA